ncbi:NLR family CARD domain-containing protein 3-like isoform X3 [Sphaeramia orbicularis]|uniref:NLR family CARD domain-containing protein 3-like n=1 Tax=Sphaeramia orbicularis TaxID=375764 RepID=A0A673A276_9TELE|nr:NLR family CARD domain-containing protein 3-like isoform X3 [Sphaeramia orbicularis]
MHFERIRSYPGDHILMVISTSCSNTGLSTSEALKMKDINLQREPTPLPDRSTFTTAKQRLVKRRRYEPDSGSTVSTLSSVSLKSDRSRLRPPVFSAEHRHSGAKLTKRRRYEPDSGSTVSTLSSVSLKSDRSRLRPPVFSAEHRHSGAKLVKRRRYEPDNGSTVSTMSSVSLKSDRSRLRPPVFSAEHRHSGANIETTLNNQQNLDMTEFEKASLALLKQALKAPHQVLSASAEDDQLVNAEAEIKEAVVKTALHVLRTMKKDEHADTLEKSHYGELVPYQRKQKLYLKTKNEHFLEDMVTHEWPVPLKKIYTTIYLTQGTSEVNQEHEIRQIETAFYKKKHLETQVISSKDILKPLPKEDKTIRTVLTMGIAGIGKTLRVQKFILDWSEDVINQDIQLLFPLSFRELNLLKNEERSLMDLLYEVSPGLKESGIKDLTMYKVLIILDGLDESRLCLDFKRNERCSDATQSTSVDVLLTNLITGNLLPHAKLWITTRPAASSCIPPQYIDRVTEIQGFNNSQKEAYFKRKIEDENLAKRVIANIRSTRSLHIMCHLPLFCWISSIVLGEMCTKVGGGKMPKTLTQMYIHFIVHQISQMNYKYSKEQELDSQGNNQVILSLAKLAFQQLEKGNLIFYEEDLRDCGIDVREGSVNSGVCTQVFREETLRDQRVFCFVHLSVEEFLAALHVHVMYNIKGVNLMKEKFNLRPQNVPISKLHKDAVDKATENENGHFDLFLRFLLGLSVESSQTLLRGLNIPNMPNMQSHEEIISYIKEKISHARRPERYINLFHCLNELNDHSLMEEIQIYMDSDGECVMDQCSPAQWAALVFLLLTSPDKPKEIHLKKYSNREDGLHRLLPAIKASRSAMLNDCNLTAVSCPALSSTLSSSSNELNHLNLSDNHLQDTGIEILCVGLQSPNCRLKTLRLNRCSLTPKCCDNLASVLSCHSVNLQELDLSDNDIEDSGLEKLSMGLGSTRCQLETLRLSFCNITQAGCGYLASAVKSNPSHLRELDLSYNYLGQDGLKLISDALEGRCELTKFRVDHNAEYWFKPGLRKYSCELTVDLNTAHKQIIFSDQNRKVSQSIEEQPYPDHPDRFVYWAQVLFKEGQTSRCYWEVEWEGNWAGIGVTYRSIKRKGPENDSVMGYNKVSWSLHCSVHGYRAYHNYKSHVIQVPLAGSRKLAVYLDWKAGILSFYRVSCGCSLTHLHTFHTRFTEPLFPVFRVWGHDSSVRLCHVE